MKTTIDIPEDVLKEAVRNTGAKTKREAIVTAVERFNRRQRLERLAEQLHGALPDFMTQEDLKVMREDPKSNSAVIVVPHRANTDDAAKRAAKQAPKLIAKEAAKQAAKHEREEQWQAKLEAAK